MKTYISLEKILLKFVLVIVLQVITPELVISQGLGSYAAQAGMNYGTMVHKPQFISTDTSVYNYKRTLKEEFTMAFPENEIKWDVIEAAQGVFSFTYPDQVINFAQANGMKSRGHFMIWHTNLPGWLTSRATGASKWTRQELLAILKNHIFTVMGHFRGKIVEYDVVNEPFNLSYGNPYGLRNSMWYDIIGPDYVDSAFVWAHRADPQAYLYLNEYGAEKASSSEYAKSDSLFKYVKNMLARGLPIHGVGLEGHFGNYINAGTINANMKRLGDIGLRVSITELDMMYTTNIPNNWINLMNAALDNFNCTSFVTWGVDDKNSWKGSNCGCLVWDTLFQKKPTIYSGLIYALKNADPVVAAKRKAFATQLPYPQTPLPQTTTEINYCQGETASTLTAAGTNLRWYSNALTTNPMLPPTPSTEVLGTKSYFVSQTVNFIESLRTEIKVTVTAPPTWYQDLDGDGKGDPLVTLVSCSQPAGYVREASTGLFSTVADKSELIASPQPFTTSTVIKLASNELIQSAIVMNISGAIIERINNLNNSQITIGDNWETGVYFVLVKTEKNSYKAKLLKLK